MDSGFIIAILTASAAIVSCYQIYKSPCRRYSVFKITDRGQKATGGLIATIKAKSLTFCLKGCLDESNCKTFNFKKGANENCELLSLTRLSGTTLADGWNHYEPTHQSVSAKFLESLLPRSGFQWIHLYMQALKILKLMRKINTVKCLFCFDKW